MLFCKCIRNPGIGSSIQFRVILILCKFVLDPQAVVVQFDDNGSIIIVDDFQFTGRLALLEDQFVIFYSDCLDQCHNTRNCGRNERISDNRAYPFPDQNLLGNIGLQILGTRNNPSLRMPDPVPIDEESVK